MDDEQKSQAATALAEALEIQEAIHLARLLREPQERIDGLSAALDQRLSLLVDLAMAPEGSENDVG